ncbi:hypothetical protein [Phenylobacterium sp.]|uniref:hypothetical protein n=1 Tax=Phenylobacterium sp. TaxID=1871053 RepID=UPI001200AA37|nr:hypothetical protein [Phenylobacterium sp.]THD64024.1 MAG: hypothetical protein E8A49_03230 [Phenylobacterium sp.]
MRKLLFAGLAAATLIGAAGVAGAQPVERYGHWDPAWGAAPPPPLAKWHRWRGHEADWYGHVHTCMTHHGYDPRRDAYMDGHRWVTCAD